ncbi:MAG TPA: NADH-quinone oxidoreductase subunit M [Oligoflexia bacterium]|nr:NADH-quinone oxidoreductase subunit M [Oligoflexia bacterium]HMP27589.1 NADH-quinone oxidoreductase subunit M [Oligoflexia bacterium]
MFSTLTFSIILPLFAGVSLLLFALFGRKFEAQGRRNEPRYFALFISAISFCGIFYLWLIYDRDLGGTQFIQKITWIKRLGISFAIGADGISLTFGLLASFLPFFLYTLSQDDFNISPANGDNIVSNRSKLIFYGLSLILQGSILGVFFAFDAVLFYVFWELMLFPSYFLLGLWGGRKKIEAALFFILYTFVGSVLMIGGIAYLGYKSYHQIGAVNFFMLDHLYSLTFSLSEQIVLAAVFGVAFLSKAALFPLHAWLPITYVNAPLFLTIIMSSLMLKTGFYGLYRFVVIFFADGFAYFAPLLAWCAAVGSVYGAFCAWHYVRVGSASLRKVVAYSSLSHAGIIALGIIARSEISLIGAFVQVVAHAFYICGLFLLIGRLEPLVERLEGRQSLGLQSILPGTSRVFLMMVLASCALPPLASFVGEFLIFAGSFKAFPAATLLALTSVFWGAVYNFEFFRRLFWGPLQLNPTDFNSEQNLEPFLDLSKFDLRGYHQFIFVLIFTLILFVGLAPKMLTAPFSSNISDNLKLSLLRSVKTKQLEEGSRFRREPPVTKDPLERNIEGEDSLMLTALK